MYYVYWKVGTTFPYAVYDLVASIDYDAESILYQMKRIFLSDKVGS